MSFKDLPGEPISVSEWMKGVTFRNYKHAYVDTHTGVIHDQRCAKEIGWATWVDYEHFLSSAFATAGEGAYRIDKPGHGRT